MYKCEYISARVSEQMVLKIKNDLIFFFNFFFFFKSLDYICERVLTPPPRPIGYLYAFPDYV